MMPNAAMTSGRGGFGGGMGHINPAFIPGAQGTGGGGGQFGQDGPRKRYRMDESG